jgi:phytoene synthase
MTTGTLTPAAEGPTTTETEGVDAREHVHAVVAAANSSFFLPMRLLPKERREAMFAVYAFCREVDDIADEPAPLAEKKARLAAWRQEIEALYAGRPSYPTARALADPVARFGLRKEDFLALIDGMEMDAGDTIRAPDLAELELYCDRVASAVGRLSVRAFGATDAAADEVAQELGQALQLTNILRDLAEDAERGRLYLPRELLEAHGIAAREPAAVLADPAVAGVCHDLAVVARARFDKAAAALGRCARRPMRPAIAMMEVYRRILDRLERRGWTRLDQRVGLSKGEKLMLVLRHGLF